MPGAVYLGGESSPVKAEAPASSPESIDTASEPGIQPLLPGDPEPEGENVEAREPVYSQVVAPPSSPPILDKYISYKGIFAQFREYQGEITPKSLTGIFSVPVAATIRQEPPIFINEGNASLKILVDVEGTEKSAPNFALRGASLKSLKKDAGKRWIVEAMPEVGRLDATLTIVNGERMMDYPLTIAPRADVNIDKKGSVDEADFKLFLSQRGTEKVPSFDMNGDGKRDYVDDYIFTANYLVATGQKK
ncbi:MAG: hypothetical protein ED859_09450 [Desulfuromonadales bacterium]|nr:MAG: hypothetical protein ED859_09450 [Desulfuromonadales bacterium]